MRYPGPLHPKPLPLQQSAADPYCHRRHSHTGLAQSPWGLWVLVHRSFASALRVSLAGMGFDSKCDFTPPTFLLGLLLCPWTWGIFFGWIQHSPVNGCSAMSFNFRILVGEDERMSFYSPSWTPRWHAKPRIFSVSSLAEKVCQPLD